MAVWSETASPVLNGRVVAQFRISETGELIDPRVVEVDDPRLTEEFLDALREAAPFPEMPADARCLANETLSATFRLSSRAK
jgi:hypothetical protein